MCICRNYFFANDIGIADPFDENALLKPIIRNRREERNLAMCVCVSG